MHGREPEGTSAHIGHSTGARDLAATTAKPWNHAVHHPRAVEFQTGTHGLHIAAHHNAYEDQPLQSYSSPQ